MNALHNNKISVVWFVGMHARYPKNKSPLSLPIYKYSTTCNLSLDWSRSWALRDTCYA